MPPSQAWEHLAQSGVQANSPEVGFCSFLWPDDFSKPFLTTLNDFYATKASFLSNGLCKSLTTKKKSRKLNANLVTQLTDPTHSSHWSHLKN